MNYIFKTIQLNEIELVLSRASIDDTQQLIDFLNIVGGETDYLTFGANAFPLSVSEEKKIILECLEQNICLMLIGKIDNEIVAQLFLQRSTKEFAHIGGIGISVSKQHWGKSIGAHMMLAAMEWAKAHNITKIQLQVRADNQRAVQLYKKLGFDIESTITKAIKIDNVYFDDYIMGMQL